MTFLENKHIVLGSASPRRHQLVKDLGIDSEIRLKPVKEEFPPSLSSEKVAEFLAELKAKALINTLVANEILITADTVVIANDKVLGKPSSVSEARKMLQSLAGSVHQVITGVHIASTAKSTSFSVCTNVFFKPLSDVEIDYYIETYSPMDKAGAYGIQEWIGQIGIEKIEGCFYNVMGLPTAKLWETLKTF